jgi:DNA modification methylase
LPIWFIKLFTKSGDWVLDPFMGSGTTPRVAVDLGRNAIGIEILPHYFALAQTAVDGALRQTAQLALLESETPYASAEPE